jgi:hypothetical protein
MGEPNRIFIGTFNIPDGTSLAIAAGTVEEAAMLAAEAAFVEHQAAERLAREVEERQEEAEFQTELARQRDAVERERRINAEAEKFWLDDRSAEAWP